MSDPTNLDYFNTIAAIVGATTGMFGAFMGWRGYKKATDAQSLDFRVKIKRNCAELSTKVIVLEKLAEELWQSRRGSYAARGLFNSSMREQWEKVHLNRNEVIKNIASEIPSSEVGFRGISEHDLEDVLETTCCLLSQVERLEQEMVSELEEDKDQRRLIAERQNAKTAAIVAAKANPER